MIRYSRWADPEKPEAQARAQFGDWYSAMGGALLLGVGVPALLMAIIPGSELGRDARAANIGDGGASIEMFLNRFVIAVAMGSLVCGPGVLVLGSIVLNSCMTQVRAGEKWKTVWAYGVVVGGCLSFTNFPGYLTTELVGSSGVLNFLRVVLLFLVAGIGSGTWIARVAWRVAYTEDQLVPPFSLTSLVQLVVVWGVLLAVFARRY